MTEIILKTGEVCLVDPLWWSYLSQFRWSLMARTGANAGYARTYVRTPTARLVVLMHRVIMGAPKGLLVDHIDHNTLNNRISNLRLCTVAQNAQNQRPGLRCSRPYKGVFPLKSGRWFARIAVNGEKLRLGAFSSPEDAARAYNYAASKYFGEFALLNQIPA